MIPPSPELLAQTLERLRSVQRREAAASPPVPSRAPLHVVYGGAHLFQVGTVRKLGSLALASMRAFAPDASSFEQAVGLPSGELAQTVHARVVAKLETEPVEDFRVDFEDGYGMRAPSEEDADATRTGQALADAFLQAQLPPFVGLRIKSMARETAERGLRTLELFLRALAERTRGRPLPSLCVTLPKVRRPEEVDVVQVQLALLEAELGWPSGHLQLELMAELPETVLTRSGHALLPTLLEAAAGRCSAVHFGAYDYCSALGITAAHQRLDHPACEFARQLLQLQLAGTSVRLSDGATNVMPIGPHRASPGTALTAAQTDENREAVHRAWRLSHRHIRHALEGGIYQGWDLHPAQLPVRYAAVFAFFLEALEPAARRLRAFLDQAAQATLSGSIFDDEASAQGLVNFFLEARACGALTEAEVQAHTGLGGRELATRSFGTLRASRKV